MKIPLNARFVSLYLSVAVMALLTGCSKNLSTSAGDQTLVPGPPPEQKVTQAPAEPSVPPSAPAPPRDEMGFGKPEAPPETRVTEPEAPPLVAKAAPTEAAPAAPDRLAVLASKLADVFFDYDRAAIRNDGKATLEQDASLLKAENGWKLLISGHCDERGTLAYNLVLGERRAQSVMRYLGDLGLPAAQMQVTSYGKEKPFCTEHNKDCWQKNRRAHLALQ